MNKLLQALASFTSPISSKRRRRQVPPRRGASRGWRPVLETLESRAMLSAYTAATAAELISDINAANKHGGANTIALTAPASSPYVLTAVNNSTDGANGLPVISGNKAGALTIVGNGDTIERSTAAGTPAFRLFDVASGNSLTLESVTLENGIALGSGTAADGGAVYNQGSLTLQGVTVQNNAASGWSASQTTVAKQAGAAAGADAQGGGIWSDGVVVFDDLTLPSGTVLHTTLRNNIASGGYGGEYVKNGAVLTANGGQGLGGALYLAGGTTYVTNATLTNVVLAYNGAYGCKGGSDIEYTSNCGHGGAAFGGAVDIAAAGTVLMNGVTDGTLENNTAVGGNGGDSATLGGAGGDASGGAVYVTGGSTAGIVSMDGQFFQNNFAYGGWGGYTIVASEQIEQLSGPGGSAYGGAISVGSGSSANVIIGGTIIQGNEALAGAGGTGIATGLGGGIFNASSYAVLLDPFTATYTVNNTDTNSGLNGITANIDGVWGIDTGF